MMKRLGHIWLCGLLFLAPVAAWAAEVAPEAAVEAEAGGSSMPQLDPTFFLSQLFWLAVTGLFLYAMMAYVALPRVASMVTKRDDQVRQDLDGAYALKQQAEDIKIAFTKTLRDADEKAHAAIEMTARELKEKHYAALAQGASRIQLKIAETESYLRGEKDTLIKQAPTMAERVAKTIMTSLQQERA